MTETTTAAAAAATGTTSPTLTAPGPYLAAAGAAAATTGAAAATTSTFRTGPRHSVGPTKLQQQHLQSLQCWSDILSLSEPWSISSAKKRFPIL